MLSSTNYSVLLHAVVSPPVVIYMGKDKYESELDSDLRYMLYLIIAE